MKAPLVSNLSSLFLKRNSRRCRASSYDRTGGNDDYFFIAPSESITFADIKGPALITHFWCTIANCNVTDPSGAVGHEEYNVRKTVLKVYWDDEESPSICAPLGDFFGLGHGVVKSFVSQPLQMSPEDGHGFNCWFPMPFHKRARFVLNNECITPLKLYFYIDYEEGIELPDNCLYFHAQWRRDCPTNGIDEHERKCHTQWVFGDEQDKNVSGKENYIILEAKGQGHYVGCNLNIHNLNGSTEWDWLGEGDDMIFVDGESWPPKIHGTGTEDYFNLAWSPTQEQCAPWHGTILAGEQNYKGKYTFYRYHVQDPVMFEKSIRVTIEHGHNNLRSDDYSSTAYYYQLEPHMDQPLMPLVEQRLPIDAHALLWTGQVKNVENTDRFL